MAARRRNVHRRPMQGVQPSREHQESPGGASEPGLEDSCHAGQRIEGERPVKDETLPVAVIMEILAREYEDSVQGEALCRAALRLAEESGFIEKARARWEAEETDLSDRLSVLLYDRRQSLDLIRYYEKKGNREALKRETDKLRQIEGRLLLGGASPVRITEEDLEEMERYIKECGF